MYRFGSMVADMLGGGEPSAEQSEHAALAAELAALLVARGHHDMEQGSILWNPDMGDTAPFHKP